MNKRFIAVASAITLLFAPATTVFATDTGDVPPSAQNETVTKTVGYGKDASGEAIVVDPESVEWGKNIAKQVGLNNAKIVDQLWVEENQNGDAAYTVTFSNSAVYLNGHTYKVHHYHWSVKDDKFVEKEAPTAVAKDGKITVTLHDASPLLIEDLGVLTKSSNGRKAALDTGVRE